MKRFYLGSLISPVRRSLLRHFLLVGESVTLAIDTSDGPREFVLVPKSEHDRLGDVYWFAHMMQENLGKIDQTEVVPGEFDP